MIKLLQNIFINSCMGLHKTGAEKYLSKIRVKCGKAEKLFSPTVRVGLEIKKKNDIKIIAMERSHHLLFSPKPEMVRTSQKDGDFLTSFRDECREMLARMLGMLLTSIVLMSFNFFLLLSAGRISSRYEQELELFTGLLYYGLTHVLGVFQLSFLLLFLLFFVYTPRNGGKEAWNIY